MPAELTLIVFVLIMLVMAKAFYMYRCQQEENNEHCNKPKFQKQAADNDIK